jgi:hypothetical protein
VKPHSTGDVERLPIDDDVGGGIRSVLSTQFHSFVCGVVARQARHRTLGEYSALAMKQSSARSTVDWPPYGWMISAPTDDTESTPA